MLTSKQLNLDAQLAAQPVLQIHHRRLAATGQLIRPVHRIGVAGLVAAEPVGVDAGADTLDTAAKTSDHLAHVAQYGGLVVVAQTGAAIGENGRPEGSHRHRLQAACVVVIKKELRAVTTKTDARLHLQLGHGRQSDVARCAGVDDIGQAIHKV